MGERWQFNSADYEAGAMLHLAVRDGWSGTKIENLTLVRKTPSGQMVLEDGHGRTYRADHRGGFLGRDRGLGQFVDVERAIEIRAEKEERDRWLQLALLAGELERAARHRDGTTTGKLARDIAALATQVSA